MYVSGNHQNWGDINVDVSILKDLLGIGDTMAHDLIDTSANRSLGKGG